MDGGAPASHAHGQDDGALARLQASVAALRRVAAAETSAHGASGCGGLPLALGRPSVHNGWVWVYAGEALQRRYFTLQGGVLEGFESDRARARQKSGEVSLETRAPGTFSSAEYRVATLNVDAPTLWFGKESCDGELGVRLLQDHGAARGVDLRSCLIRQPKTARKDRPHCFRVESRHAQAVHADSARFKAIVSVETAAECEEWTR